MVAQPAQDIRDVVGPPITSAIKNPAQFRVIVNTLLEDLLGSPGIVLASDVDFSQDSFTGLVCIVPTMAETQSSRPTFANSIERRICWEVTLVNYDESAQGHKNFDIAIERMERKFPGAAGRRSPRREDAYQSAAFRILQTIVTSLE